MRPAPLQQLPSRVSQVTDRTDTEKEGKCLWSRADTRLDSDSRPVSRVSQDQIVSEETLEKRLKTNTQSGGIRKQTAASSLRSEQLGSSFKGKPDPGPSKQEHGLSSSSITRTTDAPDGSHTKHATDQLQSLSSGSQHQLQD
ncbi:hypothetical protein WMY93_002100 [Mugilogobius chulae]|uniref:Uncharacterized protein n=1 Tax=Mugilogobius chulae TaxID=88201 RepID=A0AAW0Q3R6_9GOBI